MKTKTPKSKWSSNSLLRISAISFSPILLIFVLVPTLGTIADRLSVGLGAGLFFALTYYLFAITMYAFLTIYAVKNWGLIYSIIAIQSIATLVINSKTVNSFDTDNIIVILLQLFLLVQFINCISYFLWQLIKFKQTVKILLVITVSVIINVMVLSVGTRLTENIAFSKASQSVAKEVYLPTNGRLTYKNFTYYSDAAEPYFAISFSQRLSMHQYKSPGRFNPPSDCGYGLPIAGSELIACEIAGTTSNNRTVWQRTKTVFKAKSGVETEEVSDYYSQIGNIVIHFYEGGSNITKEEAISIIESLEPVSIEELMKKDQKSARSFRARLTDN